MFNRHVTSALFLAVITLFSSSAFSDDKLFPAGPNNGLTPGKLCDRPATYRYPEHIAYCERDVSYDTKEALIQKYDKQLGFRIEDLNRSDFKIDHYIPLCAGGSNDVVNLWPQHKSVYEITDPVEPLVCDKMAQGKLRQADAIKLIVKAKNDLSQVPAVLKTLNSIR